MSDDETPHDGAGEQPEADRTPPAAAPNADYAVGYGRPPEHGKIKPGEVRNPRGKAPGTRSLKKEIRDMLAMPVPMSKDGKVRNVTTRVAGLLKLREKALKGDLRALEKLLGLAMQQDEADAVVTTTASLQADDALIMANARERDRQAALNQIEDETASAPIHKQGDEA